MDVVSIRLFRHEAVSQNVFAKFVKDDKSFCSENDPTYKKLLGFQ